ncbi:MAG: hypothetical protein A4E73_02012 [Syntrophaceae bacterium PtaU1.Bin231]|nr:MAG: hypothetical protein A4E73_02012 [Syntrophaceae bacterium PtaU1.Bin231]HOG17987.1 hypothetical protein [Syntrophales bacterium]
MKGSERIAIFLILSVIGWTVSGCTAARLYTDETRSFLTALRDGRAESALEHADSFVQRTATSGKVRQNKYLALLERGKIALNAGRYDQCIADLQEAERRFLTIEGTISLAEGFGSILTDDAAREYEAEAIEKIMISPYLALAYLGKGDFAGALVERNRTINKINQYLEEREARGYLDNPFARLLSAVLYEMEGKPDDAGIEYRKMGWDAELARLEKRENSTDLVILIDTGLAPYKRQMKWGPLPVVAKDRVIHLGFAYAAYEPTPSAVSKCDISLDGNPLGAAGLLYDLGKAVLAQYEKDKPAIIAKMVTRMTAKAAAQVSAHATADRVAEDNPQLASFLRMLANIGGAVWIAVEQADLRNWSTLPGRIFYLRVSGLAPGEHRISIDYGCGLQEKSVNLAKEKIGIAYFSFAR